MENQFSEMGGHSDLINTIGVAPVIYRLLGATDLENYWRLRLECLTNYPDNFGDSYDEELNSSNKFYQILRAKNEMSFLYGAFSKGKLVAISGFITDGRIKTRHRGDLVQVYVSPAFSGLGIGKRLIRMTIEKAFESSLIDQIHLSVVYTNSKAVGLYASLGFIQYGISDNYFKQGNRRWVQLFMVLRRENYEFDKV